jgi:hypothetical protein
MSSKSVLRLRLEAQIRVLEDRLRALDLVEKMERELADGTFPSLPESEIDGSGNITVTVEQLLPADDWVNVVRMVQLVKPLHADAERSAVAQALRRLHMRGIADRKGTPRGKGYSYRRKREDGAEGKKGGGLTAVA